jgi:hypothetical protein
MRASQLDLPSPRSRSRVGDVQPSAREVHVPPPERAQLPDPQTGKRERRNDRPTFNVPPVFARVTIKAACRIEERRDLACRVEVGAAWFPFTHVPCSTSARTPRSALSASGRLTAPSDTNRRFL